MTLTAPPRRPRAPDPEALIAEARRRQRRRRLALAAALLAAAAGALAYVLTRGAGVPAGTGRGPAPALRTSGAIRLERPGPLAVGANGTLYIADSGRNQIVERLPNGRLQVLAGTGKAGFSGDGGPARRAQLNDPAGMTIAEDGTLYFADQANNRVRAISPPARSAPSPAMAAAAG